jgi:hypothetical protein
MVQLETSPGDSEPVMADAPNAFFFAGVYSFG